MADNLNITHLIIPEDIADKQILISDAMLLFERKINRNESAFNALKDINPKVAAFVIDNQHLTIDEFEVALYHQLFRNNNI